MDTQNDGLSPGDPQLHTLLANAKGRGFTQLVSAIERLLPASAGVGQEGPPQAEPIRFRQSPALAFPTADIASTRLVRDASSGQLQVEITTTFLGLAGGSSPLPTYMAEECLQDDADHPVRLGFLDLFHHRLVGLLCRGLLDLDYPSTYVANGSDAMSSRLLCLAGIDSSVKTLPLPKALLLRLASLLIVFGPTAEALRLAIRIVFERELRGAEVSILPLQGGKVPIDPAQRVVLGRTSYLGGPGPLPLGEHTRSAASKITVRVGPLSAPSLRELSTEESVERMRSVVALVTKRPLDCELQLHLADDVVKPWKLATATPSPLGRTSWLLAANGQKTSAKRITLQLPA